MNSRDLIVVGGANGVGKTTFAVEYASQHNYLYLGADAIATELDLGPLHTVPMAAGQELMQRLAAAFGAGTTVVHESTLAGRTLRHTLQAARDAGYTITIMYLFLDSADTCVDRVHARVQKGGHAIPEADIRRRSQPVLS